MAGRYESASDMEFVERAMEPKKALPREGQMKVSPNGQITLSAALDELESVIAGFSENVDRASMRLSPILVQGPESMAGGDSFDLDTTSDLANRVARNVETIRRLNSHLSSIITRVDL